MVYTPNFKDASGTVGTSSAVALTAANYSYIQLQNVHATNNLAYTVDGTAAILNSAGSFILLPGEGVIYQNGSVPAGGIQVIGSAAGTAFTLKYLQ